MPANMDKSFNAIAQSNREDHDAADAVVIQAHLDHPNDLNRGITKDGVWFSLDLRSENTPKQVSNTVSARKLLTDAGASFTVSGGIVSVELADFWGKIVKGAVSVKGQLRAALETGAGVIDGEDYSERLEGLQALALAEAEEAAAAAAAEEAAAAE